MSNAESSGVLTGSHYLDGDHACSEGAIAAGCRFAAGYPITPSTEVVERLSQRFPLSAAASCSSRTSSPRRSRSRARPGAAPRPSPSPRARASRS